MREYLYLSLVPYVLIAADNHTPKKEIHVLASPLKHGWCFKNLFLPREQLLRVDSLTKANTHQESSHCSDKRVRIFMEYGVT